MPTPARASGPVPEASRLHLPELASFLAEDSVLFASDESPFRAQVHPGDPALLLIVGENAAGKSLFFRALCAKARQAGPLPVSLSIRERSGSGLGEMSRLRQSFMFGDETEQSTGATSVRALRNAFEHNLDRENGSILALDEPELGLSDGYAHAMGQYIGEQTRAVPPCCHGVVVVTHSRALVDGLRAGYGADPTFVRLGAAGNLSDWLTTPETRSVADLLALPETGLARYRQTLALLGPSRD